MSIDKITKEKNNNIISPYCLVFLFQITQTIQFLQSTEIDEKKQST